MAFEQKANSGALFFAQEKKNENSPDFTGSFNINGVTYRLAGWKRKSKAGMKFISLSVKPDDQRRQPENNDQRETW